MLNKLKQLALPQLERRAEEPEEKSPKQPREVFHAHAHTAIDPEMLGGRHQSNNSV